MSGLLGPWYSVCLRVDVMPLYPVALRAQVALLRSAPVQGVSRPPHTASRDCRTAHPLPVRSRVRLHRNAGTREKTKSQENDAAKERKATRIFYPHTHTQRSVP